MKPLKLESQTPRTARRRQDLIKCVMVVSLPILLGLIVILSSNIGIGIGALANHPSLPDNVESLVSTAQGEPFSEIYGTLPVDVESLEYGVGQAGNATWHNATISFRNVGDADRIHMMLLAGDKFYKSECGVKPGAPAAGDNRRRGISSFVVDRSVVYAVPGEVVTIHGGIFTIDQIRRL